MHADVGKLKVQPQVCKVIPRAAPSVEVLSPKCNAPEIPKSFKASTLQGFFFKATTDGFRKNQTFTSCNWGPNMLNENTKKLFFLMFFHACQRRNIRLMTLSGCNKMQSSNCSCCETPFQWNLAFFTLFYMFQFYLQAFLACQIFICLAVFAICLLWLLWPFHIFSMFILLDSSKSSCSIHAMTEFDILWLPDTLRCLSSMRTCTPRITTFVVRSSRVPKNEISFGTLAGVPWGCTKPLACHGVSSAKRIP